MPEIDNELLAVKGLGWQYARLGDVFPPKQTQGYINQWGYYQPMVPDFATDPVACIKMVSNLGKGMSITIINHREELGGGLQVLIGEHPLRGDYDASGTGVDVLHALAAAFTEYFREPK